MKESWANPVRTGGNDDGVSGTLHEPDPEAVARLKALMGEQPAPARPRREDPVTALIRTQRERNAAKLRDIPEDVIRAAYERYKAGEVVRDVAAELGLSVNALGRRFNHYGLQYPYFREVKR